MDISDNQISYAKNTYGSLSNQFYLKDMNKEFDDEKNYDVITLLDTRIPYEFQYLLWLAFFQLFCS